MYGGNNGGGAPPQWPSRKPAAKKAPALRITNISSGATELRMPAAPPKKPAAKKPAARRQASPPPAPPPPRQIENPNKIAKWTGTCENTRIQFPFEPYDCQLDFMSKTLEAVATKQTALLESPTGTGKTLCLLTATLAYSLPRSSELEKTYRSVRVKNPCAVIASRESFTSDGLPAEGRRRR